MGGVAARLPLRRHLLLKSGHAERSQRDEGGIISEGNGIKSKNLGAHSLIRKTWLIFVCKVLSINKVYNEHNFLNVLIMSKCREGNFRLLK